MGYTNDKIASTAKSLMLVHGAGLGLFVSMVPAAIEHPLLFEFMTSPLLCFAVGFILALAAYHVGEFDPPPDHWATRGVAWLPIFVSASLAVVSLVFGGLNYLVLSATHMKAAGLLN